MPAEARAARLPGRGLGWHSQRLLSAQARIRDHVQHRRRLTASQHCAARDAAFRTWRGVAGAAFAA